MNKTPLQMVREFHTAFGVTLDHKVDLNSEDSCNIVELRGRLIDEEYDEVCEATNSEDLIKELADLVYVIYGTAATFGWDLDEAFKRVHESNMSKLGDDGKPIYRDDGKVLKGPNYKEPDLSDLV